jgi:diguanylate cyclase (GGDEF)-like protein/PAS domain S-box-containing protein
MPAAPLPADETRRLRALHELQVLDTPPEAQFDALVQAAALVCGVPISLVSLVDEGRQWFKANVGLPGVTETPREVAFCAHAIVQGSLLEVPDATADARFADNALVTGAPDIRFYAGAPLQLSDGTRAGTLCVIDRQPRQLSAAQREILGHLAVAAARALEARRLARDHALSEARLRAFSEASPLGVFATDVAGACTYTTAAWRAIYCLSEAESLGDGWSRALHPDDSDAVFAQWQRSAEAQTDFDMQFRVRQPDGSVRHVRAIARQVVGDGGERLGFVGSVEDVTQRLAQQSRLDEERRRLAAIIEGTGAGTWEWNVQTGQTRFNERWAQIVGCSLDELMPTTIQTWTDLCQPDDLTQSAVLLHRHFAGETEAYECEARMRHRDGHWVWVLDRGRVLTRTPDGHPEWMFGTHLDISERKSQEEALRRSEWLLNRTGSLSQVGGWVLELATGVPHWSDETCRIHGVPAGYRPRLDEAINFYAPEARPVIQAAVEKSMQDGSPWDLELPFIPADGRRIWVRAVGHAEFEDGKPVRLLGAFHDITERRAQQQALEATRDELAQQHELLRVTLQSIGDAVITTDAQGCVTWLDPVAERMTGWPSAEAQGRPVAQVFHIVNEETRAPTENPVATCLTQGRVAGLANHTVLISRDGDEFGIEDSASPIRSEAGQVLGVVLVFHDVTEQRRLSGEMNYRATHDALTGLINRAEFEARLRRVVHRAHEDRSEHALLYIDLDQFKLVNDACGHSVGDQLLQQAAKLFGEVVRARDTLARLGGDEFAVILEHCTAEQAQRVAQQICERMDDFRFVHDGRRFRIGASIGLVPLDTRWATAASVMQAADTSCYAAKEAGRNRVHAWFDTDQAMRTRHGEMQWATRLEQALDDNRFELHAQSIEPLQAVKTGLHAEILLRLRDADGSLIPPGAFLPAAERFNLAARIDRWVLRSTLDHLLLQPGLDGLELLSINLSGQSIGDRAFHRQAIEMLQAAGPALCGRLCLELTETAAVTNLADAAVFIEQVRVLGVRVALDDFGAGASSFGYLKTLGVDLIKIDGQFIRDLIDDPLDAAAVRCFVEVARVLGVGTVAEFVDRPEVLQRVRELGIDHAQGFLLHRPAPLGEVLPVGPPLAG